MEKQPKNLRPFDAATAIGRSVEVYVKRCVSAAESLERGDYQSFEELFRLQQIAWANLDALIAKARLEFVDGKPLVDASDVHRWIRQCQLASSELSHKINVVIQSSREQSSKTGLVRRNLSAFKGGTQSSPGRIKFIKRA